MIFEIRNQHPTKRRVNNNLEKSGIFRKSVNLEKLKKVWTLSVYSLSAILAVRLAILAPNSVHAALSFSFGAPTTASP
jgi:hypothetical protein